MEEYPSYYFKKEVHKQMERLFLDLDVRHDVVGHNGTLDNIENMDS